MTQITVPIVTAPPGGPHALPLTWRVLYELVGLWDMLPTIPPEQRVILERNVLFNLQQPLGFRLAKGATDWDYSDTPVDPSVRARLESALRELEEGQLIKLFDKMGPANEWRIKPTVLGWRQVHYWKDQYINEYEGLTVEPTAWRKVARDFFASDTVVKSLWAIIAGVAVFVATHFLFH